MRFCAAGSFSFSRLFIMLSTWRRNRSRKSFSFKARTPYHAACISPPITAAAASPVAKLRILPPPFRRMPRYSHSTAALDTAFHAARAVSKAFARIFHSRRFYLFACSAALCILRTACLFSRPFLFTSFLARELDSLDCFRYVHFPSFSLKKCLKSFPAFF